ncbi:Predicted nucleotidyltransferase [Desulfofundulus australicus DSM 11792]|uniref:Predicted nucleotidyltransferase n=1 Tax=Desulfofundulus australicus DSM 11792 TaxID=1121425 RepID=A0A1M4WRZ7_9FIRM|nr:nucleotidyltransferase domain-containing protein [Desulfofundulus australicus]SHE84016.1 Predicted nucleotidyltransferase [Desulfofundulus australicus DSM 11792]
MPVYSEHDAAELRSRFLKLRRQRERELAERKKAALAAAKRAAGVVRRHGGCRVWLFGSLAGGGRFDEHSDIDLAVAGLPREADFWRLYADVLAAAEPFSVDLVLMEAAGPELRENIRRHGVEI